MRRIIVFVIIIEFVHIVVFLKFTQTFIFLGQIFASTVNRLNFIFIIGWGGDARGRYWGCRAKETGKSGFWGLRRGIYAERLMEWSRGDAGWVELRGATMSETVKGQGKEARKSGAGTDG